MGFFKLIPNSLMMFERGEFKMAGLKDMDLASPIPLYDHWLLKLGFLFEDGLWVTIVNGLTFKTRKQREGWIIETPDGDIESVGVFQSYCHHKCNKFIFVPVTIKMVDCPEFVLPEVGTGMGIIDSNLTYVNLNSALLKFDISIGDQIVHNIKEVKKGMVYLKNFDSEVYFKARYFEVDITMRMLLINNEIFYYIGERVETNESIRI